VGVASKRSGFLSGGRAALTTEPGHSLSLSIYIYPRMQMPASTADFLMPLQKIQRLELRTLEKCMFEPGLYLSHSLSLYIYPRIYFF